MTKREAAVLPDWSSVRVKSCADGSMSVIPQWRGIKKWTPEDGGGPGLGTRLAAASILEKYLNRALHRTRGRKG